MNKEHKTLLEQVKDSQPVRFTPLSSVGSARDITECCVRECYNWPVTDSAGCNHVIHRIRAILTGAVSVPGSVVVVGRLEVSSS